MTTSTTAARLRDAFDRSFQEPREAEARVVEELLAVRVAGAPHAFRLAEVAGVFVDRKITPAPSRATALLGIVGIRGAVVPVFDLAELLGYARTVSTRWLVVTPGSRTALAFEAMEGRLQVERRALAPGSDPRSLVPEVIQTPGLARPVVALKALVELVERKET